MGLEILGDWKPLERKPGSGHAILRLSGGSPPHDLHDVESLHMSLLKIIKTRGSFPSEEAAMKLLYLALRNASAKWEPVQHWKQALYHFEMLWGDRIKSATGQA